MGIKKNIKVLKKYYEFVLTKLKVITNQKKFYSDDTCIKYMLKINTNSNILIVVFGSCTRKGIRARYNYVRTLEKFKCNKLFILDDFAEDHRGSYYLGENFQFNEERATKKLIDKLYKEMNCQKIILCGSSKGGYSALNFGVQIPNSIIIAGAPQFYLADYLLAGNELTLKHIIGDLNNAQRKEVINNYLSEKLKNNVYIDTQKIYLHYSNNEHTYMEHVFHMIKILRDKNYNVFEDIGDYENHSDISYYFPEFLCQVIDENINR